MESVFDFIQKRQSRFLKKTIPFNIITDLANNIKVYYNTQFSELIKASHDLEQRSFKEQKWIKIMDDLSYTNLMNLWNHIIPTLYNSKIDKKATLAVVLSGVRPSKFIPLPFREHEKFLIEILLAERDISLLETEAKTISNKKELKENKMIQKNILETLKKSPQAQITLFNPIETNTTFIKKRRKDFFDLNKDMITNQLNDAIDNESVLNENDFKIAMSCISLDSNVFTITGTWRPLTDKEVLHLTNISHTFHTLKEDTNVSNKHKSVFESPTKSKIVSKKIENLSKTNRGQKILDEYYDLVSSTWYYSPSKGIGLIPASKPTPTLTSVKQPPPTKEQLKQTLNSLQ